MITDNGIFFFKFWVFKKCQILKIIKTTVKYWKLKKNVRYY